jgi:hypothetical protein
MKVKYFYYSTTNNVAQLIEAMCKAVPGEVVRLEMVKPFSSKRASLMFFGGFATMMKRQPKLKEYDAGLEADLIVIGMPIWVGTFAAPMRTFFNQVNLANKKVVLFSCSGGGDGTKAHMEFLKLQPNCKLLSYKEFTASLDGTKLPAGDEAANWILKVLDGTWFK